MAKKIDPTNIRISVIVPDNKSDFGIRGPIMDPIVVKLTDVINILKSDNPLTFKIVTNDKRILSLDLAYIAQMYNIEIPWSPRPNTTETKSIVGCSLEIGKFLGMGVPISEDVTSSDPAYMRGEISKPIELFNYLFTLSAKSKQNIVDAMKSIGMTQVSTIMSFQDLADLIRTISSWGMTVGGGYCKLHQKDVVLEDIYECGVGVDMEISMNGTEVWHVFKVVLTDERPNIPCDMETGYTYYQSIDTSNYVDTTFETLSENVADMYSDTDPANITYTIDSIGYVTDISKQKNNIINKNVSLDLSLMRTFGIYKKVVFDGTPPEELEISAFNLNKETNFVYDDLSDRLLKYTKDKLEVFFGDTVRVYDFDFTDAIIEVHAFHDKVNMLTSIKLRVTSPTLSIVDDYEELSEIFTIPDNLDIKTFFYINPDTNICDIKVYPLKYTLEATNDSDYEVIEWVS